MIDEVMDYLKNNDHDQYPSIAIYYQIFLSLTEKEGDVHFEKLKHLLLNHFHEIGNEEMKQFLPRYSWSRVRDAQRLAPVFFEEANL